MKQKFTRNPYMITIIILSVLLLAISALSWKGIASERTARQEAEFKHYKACQILKQHVREATDEWEKKYSGNGVSQTLDRGNVVEHMAYCE